MALPNDSRAEAAIHLEQTMRSRPFVLAAVAAALLLAFDVEAGLWGRAGQPIDTIRPLPAGLGVLPPPPEHPENPSTPAKVELGRQLFEDTRLSGDQSIACISCHTPEMGYAEAVAFSPGTAGTPMARHTPTLLNSTYYRYINWDGKFGSVPPLVLAVLANPKNMNMQDERVLVARLESVPAYSALFREVFAGPPTKQRVALALDAYVRKLVTPNSPFDRYAAGDKGALSGAQKRGLELFVGKGECAMCHRGPNFSDDQFHALGVNDGDAGRFTISGAEADRNAFRTPTLRNVAWTAPYMHDGSLSSLRAVIDFYDAGGGDQGPKSSLLRPLHLSEREKSDLVAFLESLTGQVERSESGATAK
jgi:cytochrome c peroxidase